jgi:SAM domain (Sterile alpha motif)
MDVPAWLRNLGLERYEQSFREHEIDAEVLPKLTAEDLTALGVTPIGHRRKLLEAIADLGATTPAGKAGNEHLGKRRLLMQHADDSLLVQPHDLAFRHGRRCRHAPRLSGQASLAAKFSCPQNGDDRFFPLLGNNGHLHLAFLDEKNRVRRVAL